jgi:hypothetical protein
VPVPPVQSAVDRCALDKARCRPGLPPAHPGRGTAGGGVSAHGERLRVARHEAAHVAALLAYKGGGRFDAVRVTRVGAGRYRGEVRNPNAPAGVLLIALTAGAAAEGGTPREVVRRLVDDPGYASDLAQARQLRAEVFPGSDSLALLAAEEALAVLERHWAQWLSITSALANAPVRRTPLGVPYRELTFGECVHLYEWPLVEHRPDGRITTHRPGCGGRWIAA